jgi:hypothetical protein
MSRSDHEILISASRALGKVDLGGQRAVTMLSMDQIEDLLLALVIMGLPATQPGQPLHVVRPFWARG